MTIRWQSVLVALGFAVLTAEVQASPRAPGVQAPVVVQAPLGGRSIPLVDRGVVCSAGGGWIVEPDRRSVRPPSLDARPGDSAEVRIAADPDECPRSKEIVTAIVLAPWPDLDPGSVILAADEGRLELKGRRLQGLSVAWLGRGGPKATVQEGSEVCLQPTAGALEHCILPIQRGLPADVALTWLPEGGRRGPGVVTFDASGRRSDDEARQLRPARIVLTEMLPAAAAVDLTDGQGRVPLAHPEAVASVDCGVARCELAEDGVLVRSVPGLATAVALRLRLTPRVVLARGEALETTVSATLQVLHCPLSLASGPPLRDVEETRLVVRMDARCTKDLRALQWKAGGEPAEVQRTHKEGESVYIVLRTGRLEDDRLTVSAARPEPDGTVLAVTTGRTRPAPLPRALLDLPGLGPIEFLPRNREARVRTAPLDEHTTLQPLAVPGAYRVRTSPDGVMVRGEDVAAGFATLRFGVRTDLLPKALRDVDLAVLADPVQRPIREATVPVPLGTSATGPDPIVELVCSVADGPPRRVPPGSALRIPYPERDGCRLVLHRARLRPEDGPQDVQIDVEVLSLDGASRPAGRVSERLVLRPMTETQGAGDRIWWIRGVQAPFDRISVRVHHVVDEQRYVGGSELKPGAASVQWSLIVGTGRLRFYATAAFPSGLYRVTEPTGILTLNFGVLSRLKLLDYEGRESLVGIEVGALGVGLIGTGNFPSYPATLATVGGIGLSIPLGNAGQPSQASLNLHAWVVYEFRREFEYFANPGDAGKGVGGKLAPHWAFIFGPSISVGNIGTVL